MYDRHWKIMSYNVIKNMIEFVTWDHLNHMQMIEAQLGPNQPNSG
jgi:hypothetical protein